MAAGVAPYTDVEWHAEPVAIVAIKVLETLQLCPAQASTTEVAKRAPESGHECVAARRIALGEFGACLCHPIGLHAGI
jgi:hypothetical protein